MTGPVGEMILKCLKANNMNQKQLARRCRISPSAMNELISGLFHLKPEKMVNIENNLKGFDSLKALEIQNKEVYDRYKKRF